MSSAQKPAKRKAPEKKTIADVLKTAQGKLEPAKKQKKQSEGKGEKPTSKPKATSDKKPSAAKPATTTAATTPAAQSTGDDFVRGAIGKAPAAPRPEMDRDNDMLFGVKPQKKKLTKKKGEQKEDEADRAEKRSKSEADLKYRPGPIKFHSVSVGVKVLACVKEIQESDLVLSLPCNLAACLSIREVSDQIAAEVDAYLDSNRVDTSGLPKLSDMFKVGQLLRTVVLHVADKSEQGRNKKTLEVTMRPSVVNRGLTRAHLKPAMTLGGAVRSVEEKGYLIDLGLGEDGFLPFNLSGSEGTSRFRVGAPVDVAVVAIGRVISLTRNPESLAGTVIKNEYVPEGKEAEQAQLSLSTLQPGMLVQARLLSSSQWGLQMRFFDTLNGSVDLPQLPLPLEPKQDISDVYNDSTANPSGYPARVIYVDPVFKHVRLSLKPSVVAWEPTKFPANLKAGDVVNNAVVVHADAMQGVTVKFADGTRGFASKGRIAVADLPYVSTRFPVGGKVKCRVLSFQMMDGVAIVSVDPEVVKQTVFSTTDLTPGQYLEVKVEKVFPVGVLVRISPTLKGFIPNIHLSNSGQGEKKFQVGDSLSVRMLSVKDEENRVTLTAKKSLMSRQMPLITSYEGATEGLVTYGVVVSIKETGLVLSFFGNVIGFVPISDLRRNHVVSEGQSIGEAFSVGQPLQVRVLNSVPSRRKLLLALSLSGPTSLKVGEIVQGVVAGVVEEEAPQLKPDEPVKAIKYLVINVEGHKGAVGRLESVHLSDHVHLTSKLFRSYPVGSKLESLLVLRVDAEGVILTAKPSLLQAVASKRLPGAFEEVQAKSLLMGYVKSITDHSVFVGLLGNLVCKAAREEVSDQFVASPVDHFQLGQSVRVRVMALEPVKRYINVSLRASAVTVGPQEEGRWLDSYLVDRARADEQDLKEKEAKAVEWSRFPVGGLASCKILGVKPFGVLGELSTPKSTDTVVCLAVHPRHSGETPPSSGTKPCRILDQERVKQIADISFRPELSGKAHPKQLKLEVESKLTAVIQLVKENYFVLTLPEYDHAAAVALAYTSNLRVNPHSLYPMGSQVDVFVSRAPSPGEPVRVVMDATKRIKAKQAKLANQAGKKRNKRDGDFFDQSLMRLKNLEVGLVVLVKVVGVRGQCIKVAFSNRDVGVRGQVHISELQDLPEQPASWPSIDPLNKARDMLGTLVKMRVLAVTTVDSILHVDLSCRASVLAPESPVPQLLSMHKLKPGRIVTAFVTAIEPEDGCVWVTLQRRVSGKIEGLDFRQPAIKKKFALNCPVRCVVNGLHDGEVSLRLALEGETAISQETTKLEGSVVTAQVVQVVPGRGLKVRMESGKGNPIWGLIHITDVSDEWPENPLQSFKLFQPVTAVVLDELKEIKLEPGETEEVQDKEFLMHLSLRPSRVRGKASGGRPDITSVASLTIGQPVKGYVKVTTKKGCWVSLGRNVDARILLKNLSEGFVKDPIAEFPPGKLVSGHITSVEGEKADMSLRPLLKGPKFEDLKLGSIVQGKVTSIRPFGVFIRLLDSQVSGLCHVSNVSDTPVADLNKHYSVDDLVRAKVLKLEPSQRRVSFGLKASLLAQGEGEVEGEEGLPELGGVEEEEEEEYDGEEEEGDEGEEGDEEEEEEVDDEHKPLPVVNIDDDIPALPVFSFTQEPIAATSAAAMEEEEDEEEESDEEEEEEEEEKVNAKTSRRAKASAKKRAETQLNKKEEELLDANRAPESAEDFKRLLASSPDSSYLWIKLMAFHIGITELDKAREVAEQALRTINFREQQEKWNVWIALLNLENLYGTPESLKKVFDRAKERTDSKKITLELCKMYEASEKFTLAKEAFESALKQYGGAAKVWYNYALFFYRQKNLEEARAILPRALERLLKRKHLKLIQKMAKAEYTFGTVERGRTIMEGVMSAYPKRVDLWSTYLDMEIKAGKAADFTESAKASIRRLFERIVHLDLKPRQMKFCFKRYLSFEKDHGDSASQHHVKELAQSYVDKVIKAS